MISVHTHLFPPMPGGQEGVLLFCEESPILDLALDPLDNQQSLWVATTSTYVNNMVRHVFYLYEIDSLRFNQSEGYICPLNRKLMCLNS